MVACALASILFRDQSPKWISDPIVREGVTAAINLNVLPSADQKAYPGHFYINADGGGYGSDTTWPGLDSWQMAGAYLLLGRTQLVEDYFDFVQASQRKDGNIPFAIFPGTEHGNDNYLRGMKWPQDQFTYKPPVRPELPKSSQETKQWVGLFTHWEVKSNPLSVLGPICYVLTAREIYDAAPDPAWLRTHLPSVERTGRYLVSRTSENGLMGGSGFYTELPPRSGWDGVTQCYSVKAFEDLAFLETSARRPLQAREWRGQSTRLTAAFNRSFWKGDHYGEYVHPTHGLVDSHGLTDTNWAALAFGLAPPKQAKALYSMLTKEKAFWPGGVPTLTATKPFGYEPWENEDVPFQTASKTNDVAAMGRAWYLEALATARMGDVRRLTQGARQVCKAAEGGFWRERYHPQPDGSIRAEGTSKYCEYPAVLVRVVLGNRAAFMSQR